MSSGFNRREFLGMSGATMMTGMLPGASGQTPASTSGTSPDFPHAGEGLAKRPNLILFMPDEMRADSLACYGNPVTRTPNFDRLAKDGARFANCHVQFPVCGASRCSLLTGWPTSVRGHRSLFYFLRPEEPNLFRYLRRAGYDVFWYGKNDALAAQCFYDSVTEWQDIGYGGARSGMRTMRSLTPGALSMLYTPAGDRRTTPDYGHLQLAFKILERKETDRPFCIFLPLLEPHPPYTIPEDFYNMYSPSEVQPPIPPGLNRKPMFHEGIRKYYGLEHLDEATYRKIRAVYYGQVSYSDWLMGELLAELEKTGRDKDTAVFLFSDHGDYTGDYGLIEKWPSGLEDCLTHVPVIGRVPGGAPGVVGDDMIELYDVMQTALDLAGTEAQHTHFARSLAPQLSGGKGDPGRAAFSEGGYNVYEPQCFEPLGYVSGMYEGKLRLQNEEPLSISRSAMVRTQTHKLIARPQGQSELYSYADDPQERNNLFGDSSVAAVQVELQSKLLDHYINTTGIAPFDKDSRNPPPFYANRPYHIPKDWQRTILDKG
jgi:arylsulfatase A-like enzyme